jgi:ribosomal protein S18 acetylase RimI-like enzyme
VEHPPRIRALKRSAAAILKSMTVIVELRLAGEADLDFLFNLARDALGPYVEEIWGWRDEEQRPIQHAWAERAAVQVIQADGEPIGCLAITPHADHVFVDRIALLPQWQRQGIGTELLLGIMQDAAEQGLFVRLSVLDNNPAQELYARLGFRVTTREPHKVRMEWRA